MRRRRQYYRISRDRRHEDRRAFGTPTRWALIALLILAGLVVIASLAH